MKTQIFSVMYKPSLTKTDKKTGKSYHSNPTKVIISLANNSRVVIDLCKDNRTTEQILIDNGFDILGESETKKGTVYISQNLNKLPKILK